MFTTIHKTSVNLSSYTEIQMVAIALFSCAIFKLILPFARCRLPLRHEPVLKSYGCKVRPLKLFVLTLTSHAAWKGPKLLVSFGGQNVKLRALVIN